MTLTTAALIGRAQMGGWTRPTRQRGHGGERSPLSTRPRILDEYDALPSGSSERGALLRREGLYSSHSRSGARPATPGARDGPGPEGEGATHGRAGRAGAAAPPQRAAGGRAGPDEDRRWRSREKLHALLELLSESADTETEVEAVIDEHFDELEAVTSTKQACALLGRRRGNALPATPAAGAGPAGPTAGTAERADRGRTPTRAVGAARRGVLRSRPGPGVGPAAR